MTNLIAVFGASGVLGRRVVAALDAAGQRVRAVSRDPARHAARWAATVEPCAADLHDTVSLARACQGVRTIITTANGFMGRGNDAPYAVDLRGNANLIDAAAKSAVRRFVFVSASPASADAPVDFFRHKFATEQRLMGAGLEWIIVRPTAFADMWVELAVAAAEGGQPLPQIGRRPRAANFVAVGDVVRFIARAADDEALQGRMIVVGGAENLTLAQLAERVARKIGGNVPVRTMPVLAARIAAGTLAPVSPVLARRIRTGVMMATSDQTFDMAPVAREFGIATTGIDDVIANVRAAEERSWTK